MAVNGGMKKVQPCMQEWEDLLASISISDFLYRQGHNQPTVCVTTKELQPGQLHTHTQHYPIFGIVNFCFFFLFPLARLFSREDIFQGFSRRLGD